MGKPAHPEAMAPPKKGPTRTAPPQMPATWWTAPRIRNYLLFDATGLFYLLAGLVALRLVLALGQGESAWNAALASLSNPLYIAFHAITLASLLFVAVRFFGLFAKAQPRDMPVPPGPVLVAGLWVGFIGVTAVLSGIFAGVIF